MEGLAFILGPSRIEELHGHSFFLFNSISCIINSTPFQTYSCTWISNEEPCIFIHED